MKKYIKPISKITLLNCKHLFNGSDGSGYADATTTIDSRPTNRYDANSREFIDWEELEELF